MLLVLQTHLIMMSKYSKFGVDALNTFWVMGYIKIDYTFDKNTMFKKGHNLTNIAFKIYPLSCSYLSWWVSIQSAMLIFSIVFLLSYLISNFDKNSKIKRGITPKTLLLEYIPLSYHCIFERDELKTTTIACFSLFKRLWLQYVPVVGFYASILHNYCFRTFRVWMCKERMFYVFDSLK